MRICIEQLSFDVTYFKKRKIGVFALLDHSCWMLVPRFYISHVHLLVGSFSTHVLWVSPSQRSPFPIILKTLNELL